MCTADKQTLLSGFWEHSALVGNTEELQAARRAVCQSFQSWKSVVWQMVQNCKWKKIHEEHWITLLSVRWKSSVDCLGRYLLAERWGSWARVQPLAQGANLASYPVLEITKLWFPSLVWPSKPCFYTNLVPHFWRTSIKLNFKLLIPFSARQLKWWVDLDPHRKNGFVKQEADKGQTNRDL